MLLGSRSPSPRARSTSLGAAAVVLAGGMALAVVVPTTAFASSSRTTIKVARNPTWGSILTLGDGATVYRLSADSKGHSTCSGSCAKVWPPVLLKTGQTTPVGDGVSGLRSVSRAGGGRQVTFDGLPLYTYSGDHAAGQVNGNIKDTWGHWWTVDPAHPTATPTKTGTASSSGTGIAY